MYNSLNKIRVYKNLFKKHRLWGCFIIKNDKCENCHIKENAVFSYFSPLQSGRKAWCKA